MSAMPLKAEVSEQSRQRHRLSQKVIGRTPFKFHRTPHYWRQLPANSYGRAAAPTPGGHGSFLGGMAERVTPTASPR
jgi:hypothetical protein